MAEKNHLKESYEQSRTQLAGHGKRNVGVLKAAFAQVDESEASDIYGAGGVIEDFQSKMASLLGKESAVFFPSGTMAQQIALRIWCDEKENATVAYHPLSHLEIHEEDGLKKLHGIKTVLLADENRVIELEDVTSMSDQVACILLELPQREIGGQLPSYETLEKISEHCRSKGIWLHLDGARLMEVLPHYQKTAAEVCALFDSVYISLYKGIGGIAGAILAGDKDFIAESKVWKRRHGGDLISLYPYILSADYYFDQRAEKMEQYFTEAKELAEHFNACTGVSTLPVKPVSNMFHARFHYPLEAAKTAIAEVQEETGIGIANYLKEIEECLCSYEVSIGDLYGQIPKEEVKSLFQRRDEKLKDK